MGWLRQRMRGAGIISKREKRVCLKKDGFTEEAAKAKAAQSLLSDTIPDLHCYKCPYCQYWHMSSHNWDGSEFRKGDTGYFQSETGAEHGKG